MDEYPQLLSSAFRILAIRSHSIQEIKTKLSRKTDNEDLISRVLELLKEKGYLNDTEFAKSFIVKSNYFRDFIFYFFEVIFQ